MSTKTTTAPKPCECSAWTTENGSRTDCTATTRATFAMGHNAKWASWLVDHQAAGRLIRRGDGVPVTPAEAATMVGLAYDIAAKAARLTSRKPRKTSKPAEPQPEPVTATIKLGRWTYDNATIAPSGEAHYRTKAGDEKTAAPGSYKLLVGGAAQ